MKWIVITLFVIFFSQSVKAQVVLSYYPFQSIVALSSDSEKTFWVDGRGETNTFFSNVNLEINGMLNFRKRNYYNMYTGIGYNFNPFYAAEGLTLSNGYLVHFGIRFKPWLKQANFQIGFELSPYFNANFDGGTLRSLLGLSYNFSSKK